MECLRQALTVRPRRPASPARARAPRARAPPALVCARAARPPTRERATLARACAHARRPLARARPPAARVLAPRRVGAGAGERLARMRARAGERRALTRVDGRAACAHTWAGGARARACGARACGRAIHGGAGERLALDGDIASTECGGLRSPCSIQRRVNFTPKLGHAPASLSLVATEPDVWVLGPSGLRCSIV